MRLSKLYRMAYLVSFALLVALLAWMVGVYNNLEHLRGVVCNCWGQWRRATHYRNECLNDFLAVFSAAMPREETLLRDLRRMVEDSERSLALALEPRWGGAHGMMGGAELILRRKVAQSVQLVEDTPDTYEPLQHFCSSMAVSLSRQDQMAALFNHAAMEYNAALSSPSARLLAPVFGFSRADALELSPRQQETRNS